MESIDYIYQICTNSQGRFRKSFSVRSNWGEHTPLYDYVMSETEFFDGRFIERLALLRQGKKELPVCNVCNVPVKYNPSTKSFPDACSRHYWNDEKLAQRNHTCIERYGEVKNFSSTKHREALKSKALEKYGTYHHTQSAIVQKAKP